MWGKGANEGTGCFTMVQKVSKISSHVKISLKPNLSPIISLLKGMNYSGYIYCGSFMTTEHHYERLMSLNNLTQCVRESITQR